MSDEIAFTVTVAAELRDKFVAEAQTLDRPASQVMAELMRDFLHRREQERAYDAFLSKKVTKARQSIDAGLGRPHEEVAAEFAARRQTLTESGKV